MPLHSISALRPGGALQMVLDLVGLALYDTIVMVDDSGSMRLADE